MKTVKVTLTGISPYSQSRHHETPKLQKENPGDYEKRTWKEKAHFTNEGFLFIPPMAFKNCLSEAAKFLSVQIPGKGKSTYTKHFEAGVLVVDPAVTEIHKDNVQGEWHFVPADGKRGSGKRVNKCFPVIPSWSATVEFIIVDETITEDVFLKHLEEAGKFIGIGRFRPRNNGYFGRFKISKVEWSNNK